MSIALDDTVDLVPVKDWIYNRYVVGYFEDEELLHVALFSETANFIEPTLQDAWPSQRCNRFVWKRLEEDVNPPPVIGNIHGFPIHDRSPTWVKDRDQEWGDYEKELRNSSRA